MSLLSPIDRDAFLEAHPDLAPRGIIMRRL